MADNMNQDKRDEQISRQSKTSNRGFASMNPEQQREIASKGGKAAHQQGVAHEWSSDEARQAGKKGGETVSQDRDHMSAIGQKGGQASRNSRLNKNKEEHS
jgi:general stress protein YciG